MIQKFKKSRLSWYKQEQLIEHFISSSMARCASETDYIITAISQSISIIFVLYLRECEW